MPKSTSARSMKAADGSLLMSVLGVLRSARSFSPLMAFTLFFFLLKDSWTSYTLLHLVVLLERIIPSVGNGCLGICILVPWTF